MPSKSPAFLWFRQSRSILALCCFWLFSGCGQKPERQGVFDEHRQFQKEIGKTVYASGKKKTQEDFEVELMQHGWVRREIFGATVVHQWKAGQDIYLWNPDSRQSMKVGVSNGSPLQNPRIRLSMSEVLGSDALYALGSAPFVIDFIAEPPGTHITIWPLGERKITIWYRVEEVQVFWGRIVPDIIALTIITSIAFAVMWCGSWIVQKLIMILTAIDGIRKELFGQPLDRYSHSRNVGLVACILFFFATAWFLNSASCPGSPPSADSLQKQWITYTQLPNEFDMPPMQTAILRREDGWIKPYGHVDDEDNIYFYSQDSLKLLYVSVGAYDTVQVGAPANQFSRRKIEAKSLIFFATNADSTILLHTLWQKEMNKVSDLLLPLFWACITVLGTLVSYRFVKRCNQHVKYHEMEKEKRHRFLQELEIEAATKARVDGEYRRRIAADERRDKQRFIDALESGKQNAEMLGIVRQSMEEVLRINDIKQKMSGGNSAPKEVGAPSPENEREKWDQAIEIDSIGRDKRFEAGERNEQKLQARIAECRRKHANDPDACQRCIDRAKQTYA